MSYLATKHKRNQYIYNLSAVLSLGEMSLYSSSLFFSSSMPSNVTMRYNHHTYLCTDLNIFFLLYFNRYEYRANVTYLSEKCPSTYNSMLQTYIPMVWDEGIDVQRVADVSNYILGYNEPNHKSQANLTPEEAVNAWAEIESIANGRELVSPSAAPCGGDNCVAPRNEWFNDFFDGCNNRSPPCKVDYLATHTYWCNAEKVMRHLTNLSIEYQLPIWLTEFACSGDVYEGEQLDFMKEMLYRLENASFVYK